MGKRTVEVAYSLGSKIPLGDYENINPIFSVKETLELEGKETFDKKACFKDFKRLLKGLIATEREEAKIDFIERLHSNILFHTNPEDKRRYPSVTSIISPYGIPAKYVSPEDLNQHAALGKIVHHVIAHYLREMEWINPRSVIELQEEFLILDGGTKDLRLEDVKYKEWFAKYCKDFNFNGSRIEQRFFNKEHFYTGQPDVIPCLYRGESCVLDFKSGSIDKAKFSRQIAAYSADDLTRKGVIAVLKSDTKDGFSKPVVIDNLEYWFGRFLIDRAAFRKLFGV